MNPNTLTGGPAATMAALRAALHAATATNTNGNQDDLITALRAIVDAESGDNGSTSAPATAGGDLAEQPGGILSNIAGDSPADMDEQVDSTNLDTTATDTDPAPVAADAPAAPSGQRLVKTVAKATTPLSASPVPSVLAPLGPPRTAGHARATPAAQAPAPAPAPALALSPPALPSQASPARSAAPALAPALRSAAAPAVEALSSAAPAEPAESDTTLLRFPSGARATDTLASAMPALPSRASLARATASGRSPTTRSAALTAAAASSPTGAAPIAAPTAPATLRPAPAASLSAAPPPAAARTGPPLPPVMEKILSGSGSHALLRSGFTASVEKAAPSQSVESTEKVIPSLTSGSGLSIDPTTARMLPSLGFSSLEELERVLALEKALPRGDPVITYSSLDLLQDLCARPALCAELSRKVRTDSLEIIEEAARTFDKKAEDTMLVTSNEAMVCMRNQLMY